MGQLVPNRCRQLRGHTIGGHADRFGYIASAYSTSAALRLAEKQTDGRGIRSGPEQIVNGRQIEVELARPLGLEVPDLSSMTK